MNGGMDGAATGAAAGGGGLRETACNGAIAAALPLLALYALAADEPFLLTLGAKIAILGLAATGLNLALGHGGLISFGHAAFFGLGGYAAGILASHAQSFEPLATWPFEIAGTREMLAIWPVAIAVSVIAALAIGALSLRTTGAYFIMITLAFAQMIFYFAVSWPAYGGEDGLSLYARNAFPGADPYAPLDFFLVTGAVLAVTIFGVHRLCAARFGLALEAARQCPERLSAVGVRPYSVRLAAFAISAGITGLAGALYADLNRFVSPAMLSWETSGEIMVIVILGGVGRLFGPLAGALLFVGLEHWLGGAFDHWKILLGLALLGVVLFARGGVVGLAAGGARGHG